jgi:hypothetical protein
MFNHFAHLELMQQSQRELERSARHAWKWFHQNEEARQPKNTETFLSIKPTAACCAAACCS